MALQVPYAVADYWRRQAKDVRDERNFWRLMFWQSMMFWMAVAFRRYHLHLWETIPVTCLWLASLFVVAVVTGKRERKRDEWTRKYL